VQAASLGWAILLHDRVVPLHRYPMNADSFAKNKHFYLLYASFLIQVNRVHRK
jgi:hypothetical protein